MSALIKAALAGVGGFLVYEWWKQSSVIPVADSIAAQTTTQQATVSTPAVSTNLDKLAAITEGYMVQAVRDTGAAITSQTLFNVSQWNWYMTNASGIPGVALGDNGSPIPVASYIALLQAYISKQRALSGLGLGMIISLAPLYNSRQAASGFGDEEFLSALSGLGMIVDAPENNAAYIDEGPMRAGASRSGSLNADTRAFYLADGFSV